MGQQTVLVVADGDAAELGQRLQERDVSVRTTTDLDELFNALCYETVDVLVLTGQLEGASSGDVLRGVRGFYPELPVVAISEDGGDQRADPATNGESGTDLTAPGENEEEEAVTRTVAADSLGDEVVVDAVRAALSGGDAGAASRPPTRMETLAMSMFDEFPDHLYAKDGDARHVLTSDATVRTEDVIGRSDEAIDDLSDENSPKTISDDEYVIRKGDPLTDREEYTEGYEEHALTSKLPWVGPDGEVVGLVGVTRDITDRKTKERALRQQNERLAKIAIVAAHELRNELQVATGRLDLVEDDTEQIAVVDQSLENLERIVDDVVTLANAETGPTSTRTVWVSTPAREVWESLPANRATLDVVDDRLVEADPRSLRLFFEILLSNALEHAGEAVTVTLGATEDGFYVADDGDGIDLEPPERVFDVGFELDGGDVGIGLFVARRIVEDHGWSLSASNRPAGGARFDVSGVTDPHEG